MGYPNNPPINGVFYIDDNNGDFWLYEPQANGKLGWDWKGRVYRAGIVGLYAEGPFIAGEKFELAQSELSIEYSQSFSGLWSDVTCDYAPSRALDVVFTNDLALYLGYGLGAICVASFAADEKVATLVFNTAAVPADSPLWAVMPQSPDPAFAGLRLMIGGQPQ